MTVRVGIRELRDRLSGYLELRPAERTWRPGARRVNAPAGARLPSEHLEEMRGERM
ncbi:MAG: hypothetical protein ACRDTJ_13335 [Pseudonocardiaceae bacterium]